MLVLAITLGVTFLAACTAVTMIQRDRATRADESLLRWAARGADGDLGMMPIRVCREDERLPMAIPTLDLNALEVVADLRARTRTDIDLTDSAEVWV